MVILMSLFLLAGSGAVEYVPADEPLNGVELRGFRPTGPDEVIVRDAGEEKLLIFTGLKNRQTSIYARTLGPDAREWSPPVRLSSDEAGFSSVPALWISPQGAVHCVWQRRVGRRPFQIRYSRRSAGSREWSAPVAIGEADQADRTPLQIAGTPAGDVFVVTHNSVRNDLYPELRAFRSGDGGQSWEVSHPLASLESDQASVFDPQLAVTQEGRLFLLALRTQQVTTVFLTSSGDGGRSWTAPMALNERPSSRIQDPRLVAAGSLVQATWVDQPDPGKETRRLEAAFVSAEGTAGRVQRELIQEIPRIKTLSYLTWEDGERTGITWLERYRQGGSAIRSRMTVRGGEIHLGGSSTLAESREGFHFEEFAISPRSDLVVVTEKKIVTPPTLLLCSKSEQEAWHCEKIHTTSGRSDILAPMLIAEKPENLYRVIFHEVLFKFDILQAIRDTTIVSGTVTLDSGDGGASDGGGKQGDASSSQFK